MDFLYFFFKVLSLLLITFCLFLDKAYAQEILGLRGLEDIHNVSVDSVLDSLNQAKFGNMIKSGSKRYLNVIKKTSKSGEVNILGIWGRIQSGVYNKNNDRCLGISGSANLNILNLPFHLDYNYSFSGSSFNNGKYFHLNFDANQFANNVNLNALQERHFIDSLKMTLLKDLQKNEQHIYYLIDAKKKGMKSNSDSLTNRNLTNKIYSNKIKDSICEDAGNYNKYADTLGLLAHSILQIHMKKDSVAVSEWKSKMNEEIMVQQKKIEEIRGRLLSIDNLALKYKKRRNFDGDNFIKVPKYENLFKHISRMDIGKFYPEGNEFLARDIAIKGLNMRMENQGMEYSFIYGIVSPSFLNSLNIDNSFVSSSNFIMDFFNLNSGLSGRKIAMLKLGPGRQEDNHLHLGVMYAGTSNYSIKPLQGFKNEYSNAVVELNMSRRINKIGLFHFILAKSLVIKAGSSTKYFNENTNNSLFEFDNKTFAAVFSFSSKINKTNTAYTFSIRNIDPYFCSYGLQSSNPGRLQYDLKFDQAISRKLAASIIYFQSFQKSISLEDVKYTQRNYQIFMTWKPSKNLYVRGSYQPFSSSVIRGFQVSSVNENLNTSLSLNYAPHLNKIILNMGFQAQICTRKEELSYNYSQSLSANFSIGKGAFNNASSVLFNKADASAHLQKLNSIHMRNEFSYQWKNSMKISCGIAILTENYGHFEMISYTLKTLVPLGTHFSIEAGFDKIPQIKYIPIVMGTFSGENNFKAFFKLNMHW